MNREANRVEKIEYPKRRRLGLMTPPLCGGLHATFELWSDELHASFVCQHTHTCNIDVRPGVQEFLRAAACFVR